MTMRKIVESARFDAEDDEGNVYTVVEFQTLISSQQLRGETRWTKGTKSLELDDGQPVNFVDEDTFKLVANGQIIRRIK